MIINAKPKTAVSNGGIYTTNFACRSAGIYTVRMIGKCGGHCNRCELGRLFRQYRITGGYRGVYIVYT